MWFKRLHQHRVINSIIFPKKYFPIWIWFCCCWLTKNIYQIKYTRCASKPPQSWQSLSQLTKLWPNRVNRTPIIIIIRVYICTQACVHKKHIQHMHIQNGKPTLINNKIWVIIAFKMLLCWSLNRMSNEQRIRHHISIEMRWYVLDQRRRHRVAGMRWNRRMICFYFLIIFTLKICCFRCPDKTTFGNAKYAIQIPVGRSQHCIYHLDLHI